LSVLVVADSPTLRESLAGLLGVWQHGVELADDGPGGVGKGLTWRPDAAIIDLDLPQDALHVANQLRHGLGNGVLLVALGNLAHVGDRNSGFDA
jgi:DNA-binding response OmpR family regulator